MTKKPRRKVVHFRCSDDPTISLCGKEGAKNIDQTNTRTANTCRLCIIHAKYLGIL